MNHALYKRSSYNNFFTSMSKLKALQVKQLEFFYEIYFYKFSIAMAMYFSFLLGLDLFLKV